MRPPIAAVASALLAGSLLVSGCSVLSGSDDDRPSPQATTAPQAAKATKTTITELPSTAWRAAPRAAVADGGTVRLAASALPANFNPLHTDAERSDAEKILAPTTGSAIRITADGGWTVDPDYAESVDITDRDPLTVEVKLNPQAVWAGGTPITARDMVAFWQAQNGSNEDFEVISTAGYDAISAVEPGDDKFSYSVVFKQRTAEWPRYVYPRLPANVSSSPKLFNDAFRTRAISSNGPFVVTAIDPADGVITQEPNPRWWGQAPKAEKITWNIADPTLQAEAYVNDELDAVDLEDATYPIARDTGTVQRAAGIDWSQVTLNGGRGPLADVEVRRAVAHAINRGAIATRTAQGLGAPPAPLGNVLLVPGQQGYTDASASIAYDPATAKQLLAGAGYVAGADGMLAKDGRPLELTMPVPQETPANATRAEAIVKDLRAVGITVTLRPVPAAAFFDTYVIPLNFDLVTFMRQATPFPITPAKPWFFPLDSAQNYSGIGTARFGPGFDTVLGTLADRLRAKRITKLNEWIFADVPVIPLAVTPIAVSVRNGLVNYGASQFEEPSWTNVGFVTTKQK